MLRYFAKIIQAVKCLFSEHQSSNAGAFVKDCLVTYFKYGCIGNSLRFEASSLCQLHCPLCISIKSKSKRENGYLKLRDFQKVIEENPNFKNIELSFNGEIFLNPELKGIIEYAFMKKVNLTARCGVNLNTVSGELLECLVKYHFKVMMVSIDGATNSTYQVYRQGGNFDTVIDNIKKINFFKQKYKTEFPHLVWQFVVFGHNEHEIGEAKKMAKALNMRFILKLNNFDPAFLPPKNIPAIRKELGYASIEEYEQKMRMKYMFSCHQLWFAPQITWDGLLVGCCHNEGGGDGNYGNIFELGLRKCLKSERYAYAKKMLLGKVKPRSDIPCAHCAEFKGMGAFKMNPFRDVIKPLLWFYR